MESPDGGVLPSIPKEHIQQSQEGTSYEMVHAASCVAMIIVGFYRREDVLGMMTMPTSRRETGRQKLMKREESSYA